MVLCGYCHHAMMDSNIVENVFFKNKRHQVKGKFFYPNKKYKDYIKC